MFKRAISFLCSAFAAAAWLAAPGARGAVFDFSAQYEGVLASFGGGMVSMQVFDEERFATVATNVASGTTFDLSTANGVVVWSSGNSVFYYTYNPDLGRWIGETVAPAPPANDLRTAGGIVAWSVAASGTVHYRVYDRARASWRAGSAATGAPSNLGVVDGVVGWSVSGPSGSARARVYDPIQGAWQAMDVTPLNVGTFHNTNGVVAFSGAVNGTVYFRTYDPTRTGWQAGSVVSGAPSDLRCANGVVAWSFNPAVHYTVYDPTAGQWRTGNDLSTGYTADLAISNSMVVWSTASASHLRGYGAGWGNGPAARVPYFTVSTNNANAPLWVHFIDLSIGALSWSWNFGDGGTSTRRSPSHRYTNFGGFFATQTVTGTFGTATTNKLMVTDVSPPAGTVVINGGAALTTNPAVTLALSAADNSGTVAFMRVANSVAAFGAWEPFASSKSWTLSAGDGNKTVFAQFADAVTNVSATTIDTIQLDTAAQPVVSVISTNYPESIGLATVRVVLSTNFTRLVSINYHTTNGTAAAGTDYTNVSGRLDFPVGAVERTFTIPIGADTQVELNETIFVILSNPTNCLPAGPGVVTILDDDLPVVSFASTNFTVSEGASNAVVTAQINAPSGLTVVLGWLATNGTALDGLDFIATNGLLTIPSGQTNGSFLVPILNDTLDELNETIALSLTSVTNGILAAPTNATLVILDDDAPRIGFSKALYPAFENDFFVLLNIWLTKPVTLDVSFDYLVLGGSASPGADYFPDSGRRTITAGSTNVTLIVNLVDNGTPEADETVHLALSNISNADPGPNAQSDILLYDDDRPPRLLTPRWGTNGLFQATAFGPAGQVFTVQTSSNLAAWTPLFSRTNATGTLEFSDPGSAVAPRRFYRTSLP